jgi:hypothetical protein
MTIFRRMTTQGVSGVAYPFKFQVSIPNGGRQITLPLADYAGLAPNIVVDWGDSSGTSTISSSSSLDRIHTYTNTSGSVITRIITITGFMPVFSVNNASTIASSISGIVQFGNVGLRKLNFYGCTNLTSIPASNDTNMAATGGYGGFSNIVDFAYFLANTGITSINTDLFQYATEVESFTAAFQFTKITSISTNIFAENKKVQSFSSTFLACTSLTSVPSTLFDKNISVIDFSRTFQNCRALTNVLQFTNNTQVSTFENVYFMGSTTNALDGNAPTIWLRTPQPYGVGAFKNCTGLDNYNNIPLNFK